MSHYLCFSSGSVLKVKRHGQNRITLLAITLKLTAALLFLSAGFWQNAFAFDDLSDPQTLIYDTSHLQSTEAGTAISYNYVSKDTESGETLKDSVVLNIQRERDEIRRDISVDFLSGEWRIALPDFDNYRGNPVIIGMLEHLAQSIGRDTGGGALYFRNRIRDGLASDNIKIVKSTGITNATGNNEILKTEFSFSPLSDDPYTAARQDLTESMITLAFSEDIPGNLLSIEFVSGPEGSPRVSRMLEFAGIDKNPDSKADEPE